jgi:hypothetical protein
MGEHLPELRRSVYGQRLLYQSLAAAFVVGPAAHIGGYLLRPSPPTEPLGLVADLLYALGLHCGPVSWWWCSCRSFRR